MQQVILICFKKHTLASFFSTFAKQSYASLFLFFQVLFLPVVPRLPLLLPLTRALQVLHEGDDSRGGDKAENQVTFLSIPTYFYFPLKNIHASFFAGWSSTAEKRWRTQRLIKKGKHNLPNKEVEMRSNSSDRGRRVCREVVLEFLPFLLLLLPSAPSDHQHFRANGRIVRHIPC